jgi:uncharacterized protein (DUF1778 family)
MSQVDKVEHQDEAQIAPATPVEDDNVIHLSAEGQKRVVELLLNPPPLSPAMLRAKESYARLIEKAC